MAADLFTFFGTLTNKSKYGTMTPMDKKRNFFMSNRFIARGYPIQVADLSILGISEVPVMDFWHKFLARNYSGRLPFVRKMNKVKPTDNTKIKIGKINKKVISYYMTKHEMGTLDYKYEYNTCPEELLTKLKVIEKYLKSIKEIK